MLPPIEWTPDAELPGFLAATVYFPDDDEGEVVATLIKRPAPAPTGRAVLYVHGFIDYFFQAHLAQAFNARGYHFYALDLRKYGRSLRPHQHPNFCRDLREYFAEIDAASGLIRSEGGDWLLGAGHSTGGLIWALYAHEGLRRESVKALFLNSPFLDLNEPALKKLAADAAGALGRALPYLKVNGAVSPLYPMSLHCDYHGEWAFNTRWKPIEGFPAYFGWLRAIRAAHRQVQAGLNIQCPVLLMHADKSIYGKTWREDFLTGDAVLNVDDMRRLASRLGPRVTRLEINNGLHDLTLSRADVRDKVFSELFSWLDRV